MRERLAAPATASLLHAVLAEQRRPFQVDAHEDAARRRPGERHLARVERVPGEELRVLPLKPAPARAIDVAPATADAPRAPVERVVRVDGAGERHRQLAESHEPGHVRVDLPRARLDRPARRGQPDRARPSTRTRTACSAGRAAWTMRRRRTAPAPGPAAPPSTGSSLRAPSSPCSRRERQHQARPEHMAADAREHPARPHGEAGPERSARPPRPRRSAGSRWQRFTPMYASHVHAPAASAVSDWSSRAWKSPRQNSSSAGTMIRSDSASASFSGTSAASWYFSTTCAAERLPPVGDHHEDPRPDVQEQPARQADRERRPVPYLRGRDRTPDDDRRDAHDEEDHRHEPPDHRRGRSRRDASRSPPRARPEP